MKEVYRRRLVEAAHLPEDEVTEDKYWEWVSQVHYPLDHSLDGKSFETSLWLKLFQLECYLLDHGVLTDPKRDVYEISEFEIVFKGIPMVISTGCQRIFQSICHADGTQQALESETFDLDIFVEKLIGQPLLGSTKLNFPTHIQISTDGEIDLYGTKASLKTIEEFSQRELEELLDVVINALPKK